MRWAIRWISVFWIILIFDTKKIFSKRYVLPKRHARFHAQWAGPEIFWSSSGKIYQGCFKYKRSWFRNTAGKSNGPYKWVDPQADAR